MKKASEATKNNRIAYWILTIVSWLLVFAPLIAYAIYGFIIGAPQEKATLGLTLIAAIFLTVISIIFKKQIRSTIFILIIGIYICIDNILPTILIISVCTIIDEFIITPLQKVYHNKLTINKEIDKRL